MDAGMKAVLEAWDDDLWWWVVCFYARSRPNEVMVYLILRLKPDGCFIASRAQWRRWAVTLKYLEGTGGIKFPQTGGLPAFLDNFYTKYRKDWPGAYSVGPFATRKDAERAAEEKVVPFMALHAQDFLGPDAPPFFHPVDDQVVRNHADLNDPNWNARSISLRPGAPIVPYDERLDWIHEKRRATRRVLDYTGPDVVHLYRNLREAAYIVHGDRRNIDKVCKGGRPSYLGRIWRYTDDDRPILPLRWGESGPDGIDWKLVRRTGPNVQIVKWWAVIPEDGREELFPELYIMLEGEKEALDGHPDGHESVRAPLERGGV